MTRDEDRINYLAGDGGGSLPVSDRAELDELRALLAAPETWQEPDPGLEDRVVAAIAEVAQSRPSSAVQRPARRRLRLGLDWPAYSLAAIASVIVAVLVIIAASGSGSPAPARFAMVVSGTSLAPRAHGSATLTKTRSGWRIELSATGLRRLDNGRYYEAWLKNAAGILVPVGTFNDAAHVTLWSGVPVTQFPALTVTEQHVSGNPASSGQRVLTGMIGTRR